MGYQAEYYQRNKGRLKERSRAYYEANKERIKQKQREYAAAHREQGRARSKKWDEKHKDRRAKVNRDSSRKHKCAFDPVLFEARLAAQGGLCAICLAGLTSGQVVTTASADHCHKTNKARGVLCKRCNLLLGYARDSIETLLKAAEYLKFWTEPEDMRPQNPFHSER